MHLNCYKEYTRVCSKQSLCGVSSLNVDKSSENETRTAIITSKRYVPSSWIM